MPENNLLGYAQLLSYLQNNNKDNSSFAFGNAIGSLLGNILFPTRVTADNGNNIEADNGNGNNNSSAPTNTGAFGAKKNDGTYDWDQNIKDNRFKSAYQMGREARQANRAAYRQAKSNAQLAYNNQKQLYRNLLVMGNINRSQYNTLVNGIEKADTKTWRNDMHTQNRTIRQNLHNQEQNRKAAINTMLTNNFNQLSKNQTLPTYSTPEFTKMKNGGLIPDKWYK